PTTCVGMAPTFLRDGSRRWRASRIISPSSSISAPAPRGRISRRPLFLRLAIGIAEGAGAEFGRVEDDLAAGFLELLQITAGDALVLHEEDARLFPFAVLGEFHVADDGVVRLLVDVLGELRLVEAAGLGHGVAQDLQLGIGEGRE